jgi:hypothetical protein
MEKNYALLVVRIDHPPRDTTPDALVQQLYDWGAEHVQLMETTSATGDRRYTALVETHAENEWRITQHLARMHGVAHYHRLDAAYKYQPVTATTRPIVVVQGEKQVGVTVQFGLIGTEKDPLHVRVEDEHLAQLRDHITAALETALDPETLRQKLEDLLSSEDGFVLEI